MLVEFAIGSGDPNTAQVTVTATATKLAVDVPETRPGVKYAFEFVTVASRFLKDGEFFVLKTTTSLTAASFALVHDVSRALYQRPMLILDNGVTLASLNRNQLRARMGL